MTLVEYALLAFSSLFVIVDPIAVVPAFLAMTPRDSVAQRLRTARVACLVTVAMLTGFALFGQTLLTLLGITLPAVQIAGGLILLLVALDMLRAQRSTVQETAAETAAGVESNAGGIGWPFSTIIRTVLCKERLFAQLLNIMTATIATGKPNTVKMAIIAIGRTASGMSSSRWSASTSALALSLSSMVRANLPCLNLRSTRCFM